MHRKVALLATMAAVTIGAAAAAVALMALSRLDIDFDDIDWG
ncbi:hypothetical protein [uncultured Salinicola sp.]|nr:hypothetical protein [uncultured Salinicola sp.]|tara:strand:+ start:2141 stop:2266 length:126 start_codon:yes stop_codon:yes gene_type:complete